MLLSFSLFTAVFVSSGSHAQQVGAGVSADDGAVGTGDVRSRVSDRHAGGSNSPTEATSRHNAKFLNSPLDYSDARDEERATRGLIDAPAQPRVTMPDGSVVWDMGEYSFLKGDVSRPEEFPDTVNPSLWRQGLLNARYGLFEVTSKDFGDGDERGIYQVRGYDLANISFIETRDGFIVVDVLSYKESAAAAVQLLYDNLPPEKKYKKIHTVIYTHSHVDHYGGIYGVLESAMVDDPSEVAIVAPDGFMEAAVSENLTVGAGMAGRARIMQGTILRLIPKDVPPERRHVNNGLAIGAGAGTSGLVPPTVLVKEDGSLSFDGTQVEFLLAPHTEAPAEMAMLFPEFRSLCLAEIANQTQHNLLTPRGAEVRDPLAWSAALDEIRRRWVDGGMVDSAWGPHTWPRWGNDIADYVGKQANLYRYIHDQTVFLINRGYGMTEIAEMFSLPDSLAGEWYNRGYYGDTRFNVKAVYQKYLGWFDGDPASLFRLPAGVSAVLYARYLPQSGGSLVEAAKRAYSDGQYRWVVEVMEHVRLAREEWFGDDAEAYAEAMAVQSDAYEQLAYSAESGIWRNYFLAGAWRNREAAVAERLSSRTLVTMGPDSVRNLSALQALESLSTRIDGRSPEAAFSGTALWIVHEPDVDRRFAMSMEDSVLWIREPEPDKTYDATVELSRDALDNALIRTDAGTSWLEVILEDQQVSIDDSTDFLKRVARLAHIAP
jgi:alkyl sulfatase BDS1-like metallo-beta-lactamase superfamily hydrolase